MPNLERKESRTWEFFVLLSGIAIAIGACLVWQSHTRVKLRNEFNLAQIEAAELGALQNENERLRARQIPAAELAALRADHAALPRLWAELERLGRP